MASASASAADALFFRKCCKTEIPSLDDMKSDAKRAKLEKLMEPFILSDETAEKIKAAFHKEIENGLKSGGKSSLALLNTYLRSLLDGTESGDYLAVDLGGAKFRVVQVHLTNGKVDIEKVRFFHAPEIVRKGSAEMLFNFLAGCVAEFMRKRKLTPSEKIPLGFCFSFPLEQTDIDAGTLISWTKNFDSPEVVGQNVVQLLNDALERRGVMAHTMAVINNTTGTLVAGAQLDRDSKIGLNIGAGSNACYVEKVANIEKQTLEGEETILNLEWGAFGDNGVVDFIATKFDKDVDQTVGRPGYFTFEKYMAKEPLGELVRLIMLHLAEEGPFFGNHTSTLLKQYGAITDKDLVKVEDQTLEGGSKKIKEVLDHLDVMFDRDDMKTLQYVCSIVTQRAAQLVAICISCLLERINANVSTIAVAGSLYERHQRLQFFIQKFTEKYAGNKKFKYVTASDGSGKGAALVAAIAKRLSDS